MGKKKDLVGKRFGKLLVLHETSRRMHSYVVWKCLCDCGNYTETSSFYLTMGDTQSCGCLHKEQLARRNFKHGDAKRGNRKRLNNIWKGLNRRCYNANDRVYRWYGEKRSIF